LMNPFQRGRSPALRQAGAITHRLLPFVLPKANLPRNDPARKDVRAPEKNPQATACGQRRESRS
jgi:hypothetical protein